MKLHGQVSEDKLQLAMDKEQVLAMYCEAEAHARVCGVLPVPPRATIPLILHCPECGERHIDEGEFATKIHHTHSCQHCGMTWRPAVVPTVGVRFLPGFKNP